MENHTPPKYAINICAYFGPLTSEWPLFYHCMGTKKETSSSVVVLIDRSDRSILAFYAFFGFCHYFNAFYAFLLKISF